MISMRHEDRTYRFAPVIGHYAFVRWSHSCQNRLVAGPRKTSLRCDGISMPQLASRKGTPQSERQ